MVQTSIILDNELKEKMTKYCKEYGHSASGLISFLLREKMKNYK